jgi:deoxycytidylate deaminase
VISLGSNEVPRAGGGTYWSEDLYDDRDYVRGEDVNDSQKRRILNEIAEILGVKEAELEKKFDPKLLKDSQLMGALEYGRVVHAEMSALSDAARLGRSTKDGKLYTTTFPCHMCAKHIVAAGIATVVFLEPYPKSRAAQLHSDSISIEKGDRGRYNDYPAVEFVHFFGITPRRYRDLFSRSKRKNDDGKFIVYGATGVPTPIVDVRTPYYQLLEDLVVQRVTTASVAALENVYKDDEVNLA